MHKFVHHSFPALEQINTDGGRFYRTIEGNQYPSVTTVLNSVPNPALAAWKAKLGSAADVISKKAATRGTLIHERLESHIKGEPTEFTMFQQAEKEMFTNMIPHLNKLGEIHALETRLYSDKLRVAGSVDCIAMIDGVLHVVDFKTSSRYKTADDIHSYFLQTAAYAMAFWERTGLMVPRIRILMTTDDGSGVLVFDQDVKDWIPKFVEIRNKMS